MCQFNNSYFRLKPSISFTPLSNDIYQFFISDIRQSINIKFSNKIFIDIISHLDGSHNFSQIIEKYKLDSQETNGLEHLFKILIDKCIIEDLQVVSSRISHPFRRVINFLSSYIPYDKTNQVWEKFINNHILIVGAGGVGSWVTSLLAQSGIKNFTLIDNDIVKLHNLNRSLFYTDDLGKLKIVALKDILYERNFQYYQVNCINDKIVNADILYKIINLLPSPPNLIINCADYPSVDVTSMILNEIAFKYKIPLIISGGYNMHLSLIGPTIIPHKTPCFNCISHSMDMSGFDELMGTERIVRQHRNIGNIAPLAAISASFAVNESIRLLIGSPYLTPLMTGKRGEFNFFTKKIHLSQYEKWDNCPICSN